VTCDVRDAQRGREVYDSLKEIGEGNTVVKAFESHSKVKKLLSKFLASRACIGTRIVVATAGR
jgi:predicted CoA-binding protein